MNRPAPLLHIGYPKCLSTWMQQCLFQPGQGMVNVMNPFEIQLGLVSVDPLEFQPHAFTADFWRRYSEQSTGTGLLPVLSSENLAGAISHNGYNAKYNADKLYACFPDARVLIIIREQRAALRSLYRTLVAWGMPYPLEQLLRPEPHWQHMAPAFAPTVLEYHRLIAYYQQLFGSGQVKVLCYETFAGNPKAFIEAIASHGQLTAMDKRLASLPVKRRINPGTSLYGIEKHRLANRLYRNLYNANGLIRETEERQFRRMADFRRRQEGLFDRLLSPTLERRFTARLHDATRGMYASSNRRTMALTGLQLDAFDYQLEPARTPGLAQSESGENSTIS
ncbi:sulfotransferase [Seongchinamella sediminis]|uniref:sulfotransferase n=1 Tax=Seongchinamella sediminis TaxID=2283635 RepID=UPI001058AE24|nr:sulfotransferase [Seongchinamella sediminis]